MSEVIVFERILIRGGTAANLAAVNEVPRARELVFETDSTTGAAKLGNGVTAYNALPYLFIRTASDIIMNQVFGA